MSLHRRRRRRQGRTAFDRGVTSSYALRRTRTVDFNVNDEIQTAVSTSEWPFNGYSGNTSAPLTTFDFRSPFADCYSGTYSRQNDHQQHRLQVPDVHIESIKSSRWRQPIRVTETDQLNRTRQRRRHQPRSTSGEERQRRRRLKSVRTDDYNESHVTRRQSNTVSGSGRRKLFFLAAAAAAFRRRMIGRSMSSFLSRRGGNPSNQEECVGVVADSVNRSLARSAASKTENRALKALRTITIILGTFVLCFTPWHVLSLIMGFCSDDSCVSTTLYDISYWLCYIPQHTLPYVLLAVLPQQSTQSFLLCIRESTVQEDFSADHST